MGHIEDILVAVIVIFGLMITLVLGYTVWENFNDTIQNMDNIGAEEKAVFDNMSRWFLFVDYMIPFIMVILWLAVIISSIKVEPEHPFFFVVSLVLVILYSFFIFMLVDFGTAFIENDVFTNYIDNLSNTWFFIHNLHYISFVIMIITTAWFYSKGYFQQNEGIQY